MTLKHRQALSYFSDHWSNTPCSSFQSSTLNIGIPLVLTLGEGWLLKINFAFQLCVKPHILIPPGRRGKEGDNQVVLELHQQT